MTIHTPRLFRATCGLAAVAALGTLTACAGLATPEPLYDYGVGLQAAASSLHALSAAAAEPPMDYGTGLFEPTGVPAAKAGSDAVPAGPLAALSR